MQIIVLINQKGRVGKNTQKRLTKITNYFLKKEGFLGLLVVFKHIETFKIIYIESKLY